MPDQFTLTAERLQLAVPEAEARVDSAIIAMASLITEVVTARGAIPGVPAAKGHATVHRIAKAQMALVGVSGDILRVHRSEEHTSELQSLMSHSYAVFCLKTNT